MIAKKIAQLTYVEGRAAGISHTAARNAALRSAEEILHALRGEEGNADVMQEVEREVAARASSYSLFHRESTGSDGAS